MTTHATVQEGRWRILPRQSLEQQGTMHYDADAQTMGYRRGITGGSVVAQALMPAVVERFGARWFEAGFAFKFAGHPATLRRQPTVLGAETVEILCDLGYEAARSKELEDAGAIARPEMVAVGVPAG